MRRRFVSLLVAAGLVLGASPLAPSVAMTEPGETAAGEPDGPPVAPFVADTDPTPQEATETLEAAERVLDGEASALDPSPTLALTDLSESLGSLRGVDRRQARALLARPDAAAADPQPRPTDRDRDPFGDGYDRRAFKRCSPHFCVHFTKQGSDRRPDGAWVSRNLTVLESVWRHHIGKLGYRRPLPDGGRGGNAKFDVYLKNVGPLGYYGYCAPERRPNRQRRLESGYCVLDNDFARAEFAAPPLKSLRVTAAHEFFHAIQYNYDVREDRWMMEATATWIEERYADGINDNRQFLSAGQVAKPGRPLDLYSFGTAAPYGNWAFFEFLSNRFGTRIVRQIWNRVGDFRGAPDQYSMQAVRSTLRARKRSLPATYARFAAANTIPGRSYPEGRAWPQAPMAGTYRLGPGKRGTGTVQRRMNHLTSRSFAITRTPRAFEGRWRLRLRIDAPRRASGSAAHVIVHRRNGAPLRRVLPLDRSGDLTRQLAFHDGIEKVTVTLANASARYRCRRGRSWSCAGIPLDDGRRYSFTAFAIGPR